MAVVRDVMADSMRLGSIFPVAGSMSTNTGFMPFHQSACGVATKLYGVVMTSPHMCSACRAVVEAAVVGNPFAVPYFL